MTLEDYTASQGQLHGSQCFEIVSQICQILEGLHEAKYTFNDLKPDNIMLSSRNTNEVGVSLIDYGYAARYKNGSRHISEDTAKDKFQGNMLFASLNQLNFKNTSRLDDIISLVHLLFYLFNRNELP